MAVLLSILFPAANKQFPSVHSILNIFLFISVDEHNELTGHFLGFSVYISNTTNKEDGTVCFKDKNYTRATIPNPVLLSCPINGRYVVFYNNRTHKPYPNGYSKYTGNYLCEVEVVGGYMCSTLYPKYFLEKEVKTFTFLVFI